MNSEPEMHDPVLDGNYWQSRYEKGSTGWDAGSVTQPLREYFDQLKNKDLKILIPGAGNAHEAEYLHRSGFTNVTVLDIATAPLQNLKQRVPGFPDTNLVQGDFFEHNETYDLIIEQTFFCALHPSERNMYAEQMLRLLNPGGKLVGVLFSDRFEGGPPFGGDKGEYMEYFGPRFQIRSFERCYNSIPPRAGRELFLIAHKPQ